MDIPNADVRVKTEEHPEEFMFPLEKVEEVGEDSFTETKMDFEFINVKMEQEPEILMEPSSKVILNEHLSRGQDPLPGCSSWSDEVDPSSGTDRSREVKKQENRNNVRKSIQQTSERLKTKKMKDKKFICSFCDYKCSCCSELNRHLRIHTGEKPFQCEFCNKSFAQKVDLNYHSRTHTGEKPFQCKIYSKRFSHKGNVSSHLRITYNPPIFQYL